VIPLVSAAGGLPVALPPAPAGSTGTLVPVAGLQGPPGPGGGGMIPSLHAAGLTGAVLPGRAAGPGSLSAPAAGAAGHGTPAPSAPVSSRLPAGTGGSGAGASSGPGGSGGRALSGGAAALISALILVLLRLARRAGMTPVWRSYLPEVPPA